MNLDPSLNTSKKVTNLQFFKSLIEGLRPKTLTASVVPVIVGSALSCSRASEIQFSGGLCLSLMATAFLIQIGTNLANDAFDFDKKADTQERLGPKRLVLKGIFSSRQVFWLATAFFGLASLAALPLIVYGGPVFALILAISILLGYAYTGGPYPLAYKGLGEVFVILFFGIVLTVSSYYLQAHQVTLDSLVAGLQVGLLSTGLLAVNNLRDINQDKKANKQTLVVRFGETFGRFEILAVSFIPFALQFYWLPKGLLIFLFPFIAFPMAFNLVRHVFKHAPSMLYNYFLQESALLHLCFGLLLCLGLLVS